MRILVVAATKHASTGEVADAIATELTGRGHDVRREPITEARIGDAEAVVLGSAVYMGRWMADARMFASQNSDRLAAMPVWMFSVGLAGVDADDPAKVESNIVAAIAPVDAVGFAGRLDEAALGLRERSVVRLTKAPTGDLRDWDAIRAWAHRIDLALTRSADAP